jgi:repressor LexA
MELTQRQQTILQFIRQTQEARGYPPSVREIGEAVGLQSPSSVHAQLAALSERGYLQKDPSRPRAIRVTVDESGRKIEHKPMEAIPLLGEIAAGSPIIAEENIEETLALPRDLVGTGTLFALRVKGDSMVGAGIMPGDLVIIRQQQTADDGTIVAALVDGEEATVKRLRRSAGGVTLEAENPAYEPIAADDVRILGKVVAVFRRV